MMDFTIDTRCTIPFLCGSRSEAIAICDRLRALVCCEPRGDEASILCHIDGRKETWVVYFKTGNIFGALQDLQEDGFI